MNGDVMARLARANPVSELPSVAPVEGLQGLLEHEDLLALPAESPLRTHRRRARRAAGAAGLVAALTVVALVLAAAPSNHGVNVLAAVYKATSPKAGIVESATITRSYGGPGHSDVIHLLEWADQATLTRRGLSTSQSLTRGALPAKVDVVYAPRLWQSWSDERGAGLLPKTKNRAANVVHRIVWSRTDQRDSWRMGFLGSGLVGSEFSRLYRSLYSRGGWRVVGRERRAGRLLWKLEAAPALARQRVREDHTRFYVLVDPHTFLPVYTRLIYLYATGPRTLTESELVSYRTLPATPSNEGVFDLTRQHPGSPVVTQVGPRPATQRRP